ncbi:GspE/PulE family protein, partial [Photobacterium sanctipauli]
MQIRLRKRLGDLLVEEGIVGQDELERALVQQQSTGRKLGDTLIDMGFLTEQQMLSFLSRQLDIPLVDLTRVTVAAEGAALLSEVHARRLRALVIGVRDDTVRVAMSDPADLAAQEALYDQLSQYRVELVIAPERQLLAAFDRYYRRTQEIVSFAEQLQAEHQHESEFSFGLDEGDNEEVTVVKLINSLFEDAIQVGASDIHIEPDSDVLRIRQRIDGVLHETLLNEAAVASALVLRLKLMSGLDISEKRLPQDGRFNVKVRGNSVDVRVSTMPVQ